ncbi:MAG: roadblock/LC7 domain-containing protein [Methylohalobius sp.]|nr:roadblock/LC7 domain-containing protein [Methylohalobius sp.]
MEEIKLHKDLFLLPTPAGAYYAVAEAVETPPRRWLVNLLRCQQTPRLNRESLELLGETFSQSLSLLGRIQSLRWVQGLKDPLVVSDKPLEDILPKLLAQLVEDGKALLADHQGFYLATSGFPHETAEELAALSADLLSLQDRHAGLLLGNLNLGSQAWGVIDAAGNSRLGIWPMHIGKHRFALIMTGIPHFNHPDFVHLVWILMTRYTPSILI